MATDDTLLALRARLSSLADPERMRSMQNFSRDPVTGYGIATPVLRKIAAELYREIKPWPLARRNTFCNALWKSGMHEEAAIAIFLYQRFHKHCHACEFHLFEKWIDRYVTNWAQCDGVSAWLLGASIANEPMLAAELPAWTKSTNRWKRRASAVALIYPATRGEHTETIFTIATALRGDPDDMVQKGIGWMLKQTYPPKPRDTVRFITAMNPPFPRLVLRYAAEKMSPADRRKVLG